MYGDPGCQGNCRRDDTFKFKCDEFGCKEGFYSLNKNYCVNCGLGSQYCSKCSYLPPLPYNASETDAREFTCNECLDTTNYRIFNDGRCYRCQKPYCSECHFNEDTIESVCDKCFYDYYLSGGGCKKCRHYGIYGGYCRQCTDDITDYDISLIKEKWSRSFLLGFLLGCEKYDGIGTIKKRAEKFAKEYTVDIYRLTKKQIKEYEETI